MDSRAIEVKQVKVTRIGKRGISKDYNYAAIAAKPDEPILLHKAGDRLPVFRKARYVLRAECNAAELYLDNIWVL
jgi:hypothetical protein